MRKLRAGYVSILWPQQGWGRAGGFTEELRDVRGLWLWGGRLLGCGRPPAVSYHPKGDTRCERAITSTAPHRNSTWAPTYVRHPAWATSSSSLSSYKTYQGIKMTHLYLYHHFHIICL